MSEIQFSEQFVKLAIEKEKIRAFLTIFDAVFPKEQVSAFREMMFAFVDEGCPADAIINGLTKIAEKGAKNNE